MRGGSGIKRAADRRVCARHCVAAIASPRALASLKAEKGRRQQLLGRLTRVRPAPPSLPAIARARARVRCGRCVLTARGVQLAASLPNNRSAADEVGGQSAANEDAHVLPEEKLGSEEWKHTTLVRLRKFLRRQYRERKNKALESMSTTGESEETSSDERAQLQQLAADIKSIEFEIRLLSGSKTVVQHGKRGSGHGDSARSQRDTVQRLLGSAGSGERLQKLLESDERDAGGETAAGDELSAVRRNLLDYYADPVHGESIPDASAPFDNGSRPPAVVDGSIEAIEVKNHAPFRAGGTTWKSSRRAAFAFSDPGPYNEVAAWHVPQVQLEMLCLGAHCRATNFLSCSATQGINIVRVKRDDKYIARMLQYARIFHESFTLPGQAPPANFAEELYPHYQDFLQDTLRISQTAEVIARIASSDVQRSPYNRRLFLD